MNFSGVLEVYVRVIIIDCIFLNNYVLSSVKSHCFIVFSLHTVAHKHACALDILLYKHKIGNMRTRRNERVRIR